MTLHIAVVHTKNGMSRRTNGDHAAWVGHDKDSVVKQALKARDSWDPDGSRGYRVLIGTLTSQAKTPIQYTEEALPTSVETDMSELERRLLGELQRRSE